MMKKRVPEWLNSSIWSTTPSREDDRVFQNNDSTATTSASTSKSTADVMIQPPVPVPPPAVTRKDPSPPPQPVPTPQKPETKDPRESKSNGDDDGNGGYVGPSSDDISRQTQFLAELSKKVINIKELRRIASQGVPDTAGIRSAVWKLLLGYLPPDRSLWSSEMSKKRSQYKQFKDELLMNPSEVARRLEKSKGDDNNEVKSETRGILSRSELTHEEHPLSLGKQSVWNKFFRDTEIMEQIDRDVLRTHPDFHFFSGDSLFAKSNQEALRSILNVFAKLNPGIRYVQGMNEILAPIYYVFRNDPDEENAVSAEADTFFCFVELLSGFRDNFCQQLDNSVVGIRSTIGRLSHLLKEHDEELWRHLEITTKVNPQFYAFRWITLLLTQEFNFADSLHIWDTLLSDTEGPQETLLRICCAMLIIIRRRLLAGDFTSNLKLLQNYPSTNISHMLYVANKLRTQS